MIKKFKEDLSEIEIEKILVNLIGPDNIYIWLGRIERWEDRVTLSFSGDITVVLRIQGEPLEKLYLHALKEVFSELGKNTKISYETDLLKEISKALVYNYYYASTNN